MTECNRKSVLFSSLKSQNITADFNGGTLTSDAGGLLLREADLQLGLIRKLNACINDVRNPDRITHDQQTMLTQRIFGIALGYEDLNDHDTLRKDPLFAVLAEKRPDPLAPLASSPTLCRLENRINREAVVQMANVFVETFIASHDRPPKELILDFDATDDQVHGMQEGRFFHGYYDHYCFLPLYVFCGKQLLVAYLRPSNIDASLHTRAILKLLVQRFREVWPDVKITMRGDSGFCRWKLMKWCDKNDVFYVLGLARNQVLERQCKSFIEQAEEAFNEKNEKQRQFHDLEYGAKTWDRDRRVIAKVEHLDKGSNLRFVVTNLADESARQIYDEIYVARGEMENRIKEQQLGLYADRTSCHKFMSNQLRVMLASAAYILIEHIRRRVLKGTDLAKAQVDTIRLKLFKIAARVVISVRRVVFHFSSGTPMQSLFREIVSRLVPE